MSSTHGVLAATFVAGTVDYQGEGWIYPECVTYSPKQMMRIRRRP